MDQTGAVSAPNTKSLLDAIPAFVFAVDEDVRIIEYNSAAAALLGSDRSSAVNTRAGEALHCIYSHDVPEGCGHAAACRDCVVRNAVNAAFSGEKVARKRARIEISIDGTATEIFAVITASPFQLDDKKLVLLLIEDISELIAIQGIVQICMKCKKVRNVDRFWTALESYFKNNWGVSFSHGYCPDCGVEEKRQLKEFLDRREKR